MSQPPLPPDSSVATETVPASLQQAAQEFFPDLAEVATIPGHPNILKVTAPSGLWRVRGWPETASANDISFSHEVMNAAREAGLLVVPELKPLPAQPTQFTLRLGGRVYDAQQWLPGRTSPKAETTWPGENDRIELPAAIAPAVFSEVIAATARLHEATASMAEHKGIPDAPLRLLPGAVRQAHRQQLATLRPRARREPAIQRWLATGERLMASAEPIVAAATEDGRLASGVLHLGLWPAHVLIADDHLSGLLGWERVAAGSPVLDLAQATLRLQGWRDEAVEMAVANYGDVRSLSPDERRLLPAVAALDAVATTGRLLEQTYGTAETARPPTVLRSAVDLMLQSMTAIERSLNEPAKRRRTPWRRAASGPRRREGGTARDRRS